jgi:hypothetical protein
LPACCGGCELRGCKLTWQAALLRCLPARTPLLVHCKVNVGDLVMRHNLARLQLDIR